MLKTIMINSRFRSDKGAEADTEFYVTLSSNSKITYITTL